MQGPKIIRDVKGFVRDTLGCSCPDEVFERIDYRPQAHVPGVAGALSRILVGDRLLVYVLFADDPRLIAHNLDVVLAQGKQERDACGYNRLRTVVVTQEVGPIERLVESKFRNQAAVDAHTYIHVVSANPVLDK